MIPTLIIEDEQPISELIRTLVLETDSDLQVVGVCDNIRQALECIRAAKPQLIFLDIMLPGGTAFDLLKQLPEIDFELIFITAYDDYLAEAIGYAANGYLVKPIRSDDLKRAIGNAKKRILKGLNAGQMVAMLDRAYQKRAASRKIAISTFAEYLFVDIDHIIRCESQNMYSYLYTTEKKIFSSFSLKQLAAVLPEDHFFQVHKSHIISLNKVASYNVRDSLVVLDDGTELPVSRRRKADFLEKFIQVVRE